MLRVLYRCVGMLGGMLAGRPLVGGGVTTRCVGRWRGVRTGVTGNCVTGRSVGAWTVGSAGVATLGGVADAGSVVPVGTLGGGAGHWLAGFVGCSVGGSMACSKMVAS